MNPILAVGQIIVSVFLIIAVLMQARGVGLSSAFGGDSSGRVCLDPQGIQMCSAGSLPTGCTVLGR